MIRRHFAILGLLVALSPLCGCLGSPASSAADMRVAATYLAAVATASSADLQDTVPLADYERYLSPVNAREESARAGDVSVALSTVEIGREVRVHYEVSTVPGSSTLTRGSVRAWQDPQDGPGVVRGVIDKSGEVRITVETVEGARRVTRVSGESPSAFFARWRSPSPKT